MKNLIPPLRRLNWLLLILFVAPFQSCTDKCEVTTTYTYFEPVYATREEVKAAVGLRAPKTISKAGRIYFKDGILFINESGRGHSHH
jgi:hypothetical protein